MIGQNNELLLFIHKRIWENVEILNSTDMEDRIWIKLQNKQKYIFICFCYMPPQGSTISCNRTSEWGSLEREIVKFSLDGNLIICGDLNARTGTMCDYIESDSEMPQNSPLTYIVDQDYPRVSQDLSVNTQGRCLLDLCIGSRLRILNGRHKGDSSGKYTCYTPNGCSVVDYVIVSADIQHLISKFSIHPLTMYSDHSPLTFSLEIQPAINRQCSLQGKTVNLQKPIKLNMQLFNQKQQCDQRILNNLYEIRRSMPFTTADAAAERITDMITGLALGPSNETTAKTFPKNKWFDTECKLQKRRVNDAKKKFISLPNNPLVRQSYYQEKKKFKTLLKTKKKEASSNLHALLMTTYRADPQKFWRLVSRSRPKQDTALQVDPCILRGYFEGLNADTTGSTADSPVSPALPYVPELDDPICYEEVLHAIAHLKSNRAPGTDGIPAEAYKKLSGNFISILTNLFNHILNTGHYPQQWSTGILTPVHKGGSRYDPQNYRGITVLNCIGKIFTSILNSRITDWAEERSLIPESQFGFRKYRSMLDCIFILNTAIEVSMSQKKQLYVCYIDFKKAFDSINHKLLWSCLRGRVHHFP